MNNDEIIGFLGYLSDRAKFAQLNQNEIFKQVKEVLPRGVRHASGGLPDARGVSDVDISLYRKNHNNLISQLPKGTKTKNKKTHTIYTIPGYDREVNLYATGDKTLYQRGLQHRNVELALGDGLKRPAESEMWGRINVRKGLVANQNIPKGKTLTNEMISVKRPGDGIKPKYFEDLIGKITLKDIKKDESIKWEMLKR